MTIAINLDGRNSGKNKLQCLLQQIVKKLIFLVSPTIWYSLSTFLRNLANRYLITLAAMGKCTNLFMSVLVT
jgi:hypothetical protein